MKLLVLILCSAAIASGSVHHDRLPLWRSFKNQHGKKYAHSMEDGYRMDVFFDNKAKIEKHNELYQQGLVNFTLSLNKFADLTNKEFAEMMNGYNRDRKAKSLPKNYFVAPKDISVPSSIDWRSRGYVTPVKDQGQCGSCWAFSTTGALEGQHYAKTGKLVSLSEQQLIDCSSNYGNQGCNGGLMDSSFKYIRDNGGIDTEQYYPYIGIEGYCSYNSAYIGSTCSGYIDVRSGDESALKDAVGTVGPVSVAIDAGHMSFQFYNSGVYYEPYCSATFLDHGVLVVGYGTQNGKDYWIVKNSWGSNWGQNGYILMARNQNNNCGIATEASYPLV